MSTSASILESFLKRSGYSCLQLYRESGVHFSTIYKVRHGQRKSFSLSAARKIHAVNPKLLPLDGLLGLRKGALNGGGKT
jgi:hypothetical protein